jgi:hypothetical protein
VTRRLRNAGWTDAGDMGTLTGALFTPAIGQQFRVFELALWSVHNSRMGVSCAPPPACHPPDVCVFLAVHRGTGLLRSSEQSAGFSDHAFRGNVRNEAARVVRHISVFILVPPAK